MLPARPIWPRPSRRSSSCLSHLAHGLRLCRKPAQPSPQRPAPLQCTAGLPSRDQLLRCSSPSLPTRWPLVRLQHRPRPLLPRRLPLQKRLQRPPHPRPSAAPCAGRRRLRRCAAAAAAPPSTAAAAARCSTFGKGTTRRAPPLSRHGWRRAWRPARKAAVIAAVPRLAALAAAHEQPAHARL